MLVEVLFERRRTLLPHPDLTATETLRRAGIPHAAETVQAARRLMPPMARAGLVDVSAIFGTPVPNLTGDAPLLGVALGLAAALDDAGAEVFVALGALKASPDPAGPLVGTASRTLPARLELAIDWLERRAEGASPVPVLVPATPDGGPAIPDTITARLYHAGGRLVRVSSLAAAVKIIQGWPPLPSRTSTTGAAAHEGIRP